MIHPFCLVHDRKLPKELQSMRQVKEAGTTRKCHLGKIGSFWWETKRWRRVDQGNNRKSKRYDPVHGVQRIHKLAWEDPFELSEPPRIVFILGSSRCVWSLQAITWYGLRSTDGILRSERLVFTYIMCCLHNLSTIGNCHEHTQSKTIINQVNVRITRDSWRQIVVLPVYRAT